METNIKDETYFENLRCGSSENYLDIQTARKIRELFGECSSLYECHTVQELIDDYAEMVAEQPETTIGYWLGIQLSIEDAFGTPSEMITDIRARLNPYWTPITELPERPCI